MQTKGIARCYMCRVITKIQDQAFVYATDKKSGDRLLACIP